MLSMLAGRLYRRTPRTLLLGTAEDRETQDCAKYRDQKLKLWCSERKMSGREETETSGEVIEPLSLH